MFESEAGTVTNGLEAQTFRRELGSGVLLKVLSGAAEGSIGAGKSSLLTKLRSNVGTVERSKEGLGGTEAVMAGGTAFAQDGDLNAAEGGEGDAAGGAVGVEEVMGTGGAGLEV